jgi:hypothetical protein
MNRRLVVTTMVVALGSILAACVPPKSRRPLRRSYLPRRPIKGRRRTLPRSPATRDS